MLSTGIRLNMPFSSSRWRRRRASKTSNPPYLQNVAMLSPCLRQAATGEFPGSFPLIILMICSSPLSAPQKNGSSSSIFSFSIGSLYIGSRELSGGRPRPVNQHHANVKRATYAKLRCSAA
ncbi:MAG: hypothetical protein P4L87_15115 [Formivibrio sp.]|nr:hypothetical protein [Formivibrio sp.]